MRPSPCTPTLRTPANSTTGNCHTRRSNPAAVSSSRAMASARCRVVEPLLRHFPDDPDRQAGAGERVAPHHVLRQAQRGAHSPHLVLEQVRSGSTSSNSRSSGRPPTLWWLLMFAVPVPPPDSTTSGYRVPCTRKRRHRHPRPPHRRPRPLEDPDELAADDLALGLGLGHAGQRIEEPLPARRPPSAGRRWPPRSPARPAPPRPGAAARGRRTRTSAGPRWRAGPGRPRRLSPPLRTTRRPHGRRRPAPRWPPPGHRSRPRWTSWGSARRRRRGSAAGWPDRDRCAATSGWNCTPASGREPCTNAATGVAAVVATTSHPGGACTTASPWDIHTDCSEGCPTNRTESLVCRAVRPYSRRPVSSTWPPSATAITWKP